MADRTSLVAARTTNTLEAVRSSGGTFDVDAYHVMDQRDNALIADELLNGAQSAKFVYSFPIKGSGDVSGVSVIGARHLASYYGGLQHRLVASTQKTGALFIFTSFPAENTPMDTRASVIRELESEDDFYSVVVEIKDIKTGNSIQVEAKETRFERDRGGNMYERPHYAKIAQSKGYRNAVLDLLPQDVILRWKELMLKANKNEVVTQSVLEEKRANVLKFAASKAIPIERLALEALTMDQIAGLGEAARGQNVQAFTASAQVLGLMGTGEVLDSGKAPATTADTTKEPAKAKAKAPEKAKDPAPPADAKPAAPAAQTTQQQGGDKNDDQRPTDDENANDAADQQQAGDQGGGQLTLDETQKQEAQPTETQRTSRRGGTEGLKA